jgi:hypothetical protein
VFAPDEAVLGDALWALAFVAEGSPEGLQLVLNANVLGQVTALLGHKEFTVAQPALRLCGNITGGTDDQTGVALGCGLMEKIKPVLSSPKQALRKDAAWLLSNVAAGPPGQVEEIFNEGLVEELMGLADSGPFDVRKEAVWALANMSMSGSPPQLERLIMLNVVPVLCGHFGGKDVDTVVCVMNAVRNLLLTSYSTESLYYFPTQQVEEHGLDKLEDLQNDENTSVSELAVVLCQMCHWNEDEEHETVEHTGVPQSGFDFSEGNLGP